MLRNIYFRINVRKTIKYKIFRENIIANIWHFCPNSQWDIFYVNSKILNFAGMPFHSALKNKRKTGISFVKFIFAKNLRYIGNDFFEKVGIRRNKFFFLPGITK